MDEGSKAQETFADYCDRCNVGKVLAEVLEATVSSGTSHPVEHAANLLALQWRSQIISVTANVRCDPLGRRAIVVCARTRDIERESGLLFVADGTTHSDSATGESVDFKFLVNTTIAARVLFKDCRNQSEVDERLQSGSEPRELLLLVSSVIAKLGAAVRGIPLHKHLSTLMRRPTNLPGGMPLVCSVLDSAGRYVAVPDPEVHFSVRSMVETLVDADKALRSATKSEHLNEEGSYTAFGEAANVEKTVLAALGSRAVLLGKRCDTEKHAISCKEASDAGFPCAIDARDAVESESLVAIADNLVWNSSNKKPSERLSNTKCAVSMRVNAFSTLTELLSFAATADERNVRLVLFVPAIEGTGADTAPLLLPHVAVASGAQMVVMGVPNGGHHTACANELMRIEESFVEEHGTVIFRPLRK